MNQLNSTTVSEVELASQLSIHPILVLYFAEQHMLDCSRDELGPVFDREQIARFCSDHPALLEQAKRRTERITSIIAAREALETSRDPQPAA